MSLQRLVGALVSAASMSSIRDPILRNAVVGSIGLHLALLILGPAPADSAPTRPAAMRLMTLPPDEMPPDEMPPDEIPPEVPLMAEEPFLEDAPVAESGAGEIVEDPDAASAEASVAEAAPEPVIEDAIIEEVMIEDDVITAPAEAVETAPDPSDAAEDDADAQKEADADEQKDFDLDAVNSLLDATAALESDRSELKRYRFQIREKLKRALDAQAAESGKERPSFVLRFRIDDEGYIFDLSLLRPAGAAPVSREVRDLILGLSPLPAPPTGKVLQVQYRIDFKTTS